MSNINYIFKNELTEFIFCTKSQVKKRYKWFYSSVSSLHFQHQLMCGAATLTWKKGRLTLLSRLPHKILQNLPLKESCDLPRKHKEERTMKTSQGTYMHRQKSDERKTQIKGENLSSLSLKQRNKKSSHYIRVSLFLLFFKCQHYTALICTCTWKITRTCQLHTRRHDTFSLSSPLH